MSIWTKLVLFVAIASIPTLLDDLCDRLVAQHPVAANTDARLSAQMIASADTTGRQ